MARDCLPATTIRAGRTNSATVWPTWLMMAAHWSATMTVAHYINENKSDMRGIKCGWYAMEDHGKLSSGPFSSHAECLHNIHSADEWIDSD